MIVQNMPVVDTQKVVVDKSITNARHAYNLLQKNKLISEFKSIHVTRETIEILCNKELDGVIPSLFKSAQNYPNLVERVVFSLVLCQYAKSKLMSTSENSLKTEEIQEEINKLKEDFFDTYKNYLAVKDHPITTEVVKWNPKFSLESVHGHLVPIFGPGRKTETTTSNEDLTNSFKKLERIYIDAKGLYDKIEQNVDFSQIRLNDDSVKDFSHNSSYIAKPVAKAIEEENDRKILNKWIRYAFSFKGDLANEETILSLSKLS